MGIVPQNFLKTLNYEKKYNTDWFNIIVNNITSCCTHLLNFEWLENDFILLYVFRCLFDK